MNKKNFFLLLVIALFFGNILSAQEAIPPLKPIQKEAIKKAIESGEIDKATVEKLKEKVEKEKSEEQVEKEKGR
ncbi:MAG TPA: hypothetical protein EYP78_04545 [Candidatus Omnitrophica bacterium]|nr:hypothetical protein [Candidatus Omnitrophota bacterium]